MLAYYFPFQFPPSSLLDWPPTAWYPILRLASSLSSSSCRLKSTGVDRFARPTASNPRAPLSSLYTKTAAEEKRARCLLYAPDSLCGVRSSGCH
ncbi:hypothetical protein MUK42_10628 [Musa troglodytarum]|uniref:Uncharacterized protein n=1 Tax=Musa troglodytarum TaxID=320322 RepID=A0A9E7FG04_9LILI|nr:hypothetical protein MUK42_10628 [Musa troglodytarum]